MRSITYTCSKHNYSGVNQSCPDCKEEFVRLQSALSASQKEVERAKQTIEILEGEKSTLNRAIRNAADDDKLKDAALSRLSSEKEEMEKAIRENWANEDSGDVDCKPHCNICGEPIIEWKDDKPVHPTPSDCIVTKLSKEKTE